MVTPFSTISNISPQTHELLRNTLSSWNTELYPSTLELSANFANQKI